MIEKRIKSEITVSKNQFGYISGKSTMKPVICMSILEIYLFISKSKIQWEEMKSVYGIYGFEKKHTMKF